MTPELQDYTLPRTGRLPLAFRGEVLSEAQGEQYLDDRGKNPRWHDLEVYRTAAGKYVVAVRYRTEWPGEVGFDDVLVFGDPRDVTQCLLSWEPTAHVRGYPEGVEDYAKKQGRLLADVRARWGRCVTDLFAGLGPEFSERVE